MLSNLFYIIFSLYFILLLSNITGYKKSEIVLCACAAILDLFTLLYTLNSSGNLPLFNIFESFLFMAFLLTGMGFPLIFRGESRWTRRWVWIEIIILFIIMLFFPKEASLPVYDHGYSYIVLFHGFRCIALALMLFAAAWFIQFIIQREMDERTGMLAHQGRNYLVLSAVFYLMGEYVGIIWCQKGWGDFWMWNQTFFQSTLVVLYLMLAFHIPGKGRKAEDVRCVIGGFSGFFTLILSVVRSMY